VLFKQIFQRRACCGVVQSSLRTASSISASFPTVYRCVHCPMLFPYLGANMHDIALQLNLCMPSDRKCPLSALPLPLCSSSRSCLSPHLTPCVFWTPFLRAERCKRTCIVFEDTRGEESKTRRPLTGNMWLSSRLLVTTPVFSDRWNGVPTNWHWRHAFYYEQR
jgi:hypothetical protein